MQRLLYILPFFIFALYSCGSQKAATPEVEVQPKPTWVSGKPIENTYYAGIGTAFKRNGADFAAIAKNNALNDLASEISVNVNSSSLFYQIEQDENLRQEFQANTRLKSKENLAGYELVDTWEDENTYWVYYRLNKFDYERIKEQRLNKAVALSKQLFSKAVIFRENYQYAEALKFSVKATEALKDYMAEPIQTDWQGKNIFLLVELYSFMQQTLSSIKLQAVYPQINTKRGESVSAEMLTFLVQTEKGIPLSSVPIYLYYSGKRISNNQLNSNTIGEVNYTLNKISSTNNLEYLQANVNMVSLVSEASEDPFIRKLLAKLSGPEAKIEITIEKPRIYILSTEKNMGTDMPTQILANAFKQNFINQGFEVVPQNQADFILTIRSNTSSGGRQGKFYTSGLNASIEFRKTNQQLVYEKQITGFMGMQLDQKKAGEDAYRKLANEINKRYFREMRRQVFD